MKAFIGLTDLDWYELLAGTPGLEEANFWQPSGSRAFRALDPGELFLFKLHSPRNFIVGGGLFAHWTRLPVSMAWEAFGIANGALSLAEVRARIARYRRSQEDRHADYEIGCILLEQPFFLEPEKWIPAPDDWAPNIVTGKSYDLNAGAGRLLWERLQEALGTRLSGPREAGIGEGDAPRYGDPILVRPRLGQGSFRVLVTDAYARRCAVTGERVLPVLEAAHIRPYADGGEHRVENGILLRRDLHALFDRGYLTATPELRLEVSRRIREDWENGRDYYALQGQELRPPEQPYPRPPVDLLRWHNENVYLG